MAQDGYIGADMAIAVNAITSMAKAFRVELGEREATFTPLDTEKILRRQLEGDATITLTIYESDKANAGSFKTLGEAKLTKAPVTILSWTDKGTTPASRLPTSFFTIYPLTGWRVVSVTSGPESQDGTVEVTAVLKPNHI